MPKKPHTGRVPHTYSRIQNKEVEPDGYHFYLKDGTVFSLPCSSAMHSDKMQVDDLVLLDFHHWDDLKTGMAHVFVFRDRSDCRSGVTFLFGFSVGKDCYIKRSLGSV